MIFYTLINESNWKNIESSLTKYYPQTKLSIEKYKKVFLELKKLSPISNNLRLAVYRYTDSNSFNVCGLDGTLCCEIPEFDVDRYPEETNKEYGYAIGFAKCEEWLGMEIDMDTLNTMSKDGFIAHCFWEMQFYTNLKTLGC